MKFVYGINNVNKYNQNSCILTIGNFDGVHLGHQYLLTYIKKKSIALNFKSVVILFEPHPLEFFHGNKAPPRLTCLRTKLYYIFKIGIDLVICINFNSYFSKKTPNNFIKLLLKKLNIKILVVGNDFRFGYDRLGDFCLLKKFGIKYGFNVINIKSFYIKKDKVSSTLIRKTLLKDNFKLAKKFLGYSFYIFGRVIHGDAFGRLIGFPTANIFLKKNFVSPIKGTYAVYINGIGKKPLPGILNIGIRPTISSSNKQQCEVYILHFNQNLYGKYINIKIIKKIRKEKKFSSIYNLKKQIIKDIFHAKKIFYDNGCSNKYD